MNKIIEADMEYINNSVLEWERLSGKTVMITGATGLVGSEIVRNLIYRNQKFNSDITILILSRSMENIEYQFGKYFKKPYFKVILQDISLPISTDIKADYIIHAASKGDPKSFVENPIGVMDSAYIGTKNVLEYACKCETKKTVFISSGEVYGILDDGGLGIREDSFGYIDVLNSRNCYSIGKIAAETLCSCYRDKYNVDVSIARLCHTYGGNILKDENRVIFQFIKNAISGDDIVLKSNGIQKRSYCYIADSIKGIFYVLLKGQKGEAYNISNKNSILTIRELAETIAELSDRKVVFENQKEIEKKGNSGINNAVLNSQKLENLGFNAEYDIKQGIKNTIHIMKEKGYEDKTGECK